MEQLILAFITGLTTGGLSCLAVQGGLLAGSLARQIEQDVLDAPAATGKVENRVPTRPCRSPCFLLAKLVAYTLLGALLGLAGSFLTLSPVTRAILMLAIGVFMVGNGLRMLNVHPIFRYFVIEPPRFITRYIRRRAKGQTELFAPLFLGALTVLIPCGVTQAMMAAALGTGSPTAGAALMFAFVLGTSPVFFLVAYLATELGKRLESYFMRFVAIVVLILGLVTIESGLNLLGSPLSFANLTANLRPAAQAAPTPSAAPAPATAAPKSPPASTAGGQVTPAAPAGPTKARPSWSFSVANNGYFPKVLYASADQKVALDLVTNKTTSCARDFVIPSIKYYQLLPNTGRVTADIPPQKAGTVMRFACSMGMYTGPDRVSIGGVLVIKKIYTVNDMTCANCAMRIEEPGGSAAGDR